MDFLNNPDILYQLDVIKSQFAFATWETLYALVFQVIFSYILGLPLGVLLVTGEKDGIHPLPGWLMKILNVAINMLRSVPFLILMIIALPLSKLIMGTKIGTEATIPPMVVAAFPLVARMVESSLREVDQGVIEAAQSMGASTWQIITKVMLPECKPSLINGATNASITILGYGAMAGNISGGGLGAIALMRGYGRNQRLVLYVAVIILVILVQVIQSIGTALCVKTDKRISHKTRKGE